MISVLILTLNEEKNLPRCLDSVRWSDDIVVLDSGSTDSTEEIARFFGARVVERTFTDYASQRNYGLEKIKYRHPWVIMVDADEEVPPQLAEELKAIVSGVGSDLCLVRMRRRDYFMGRWIRHASGYPTWFGRLVRIGRVRVQRSVNEDYLTEGKIVNADGHLNHFPFNKGFEAWFEKHNRYSTMEAGLANDTDDHGIQVGDLFSADPVVRRKGYKTLIYRMPFRPLIVFLVLFIFRGGFLDGKAGFHFCLLKSIYEYLTIMKIREDRLRRSGSSY